jgi:serine/threonine-protein kinase
VDECISSLRVRRHTGIALPKIVNERFRLDALLGAGGMGIVYRATDVLLLRSLALKTLPRLSHDAAAKLLDEARTMAALSHPQIAVLYGAEQWRRTPLLLVELLEGGTLAERLRRGPLGPADALRIVHALAAALVHMSAAGRYHGDIKPSNIGFTTDGVPKFLDFGLSRAFIEDEHQPPRLAGTLSYMSPEVLDGAAPGASSDLWALSTVLFELVTGSHPFLHETRTISRIRAGVPPASLTQSSLPQPLANLLYDLLSADGRRRPATASSFVQRVSETEAELAADAPPAGPTRRIV